MHDETLTARGRGVISGEGQESDTERSQPRGRRIDADSRNGKMASADGREDEPNEVPAEEIQA